MESNTHATFTSVAQADLVGSEWFHIREVREGSALLVDNVAVFNISGHLCATQSKCPHQQGPIIEGHIAGSTVTCPWHGSQFDVCTGAVLHGPAIHPLQIYRVIVEGERARVESIPHQDASNVPQTE
ncbi:MAG TPA: Rieske (2Fe-2S) protein [Alloacidobacterium sp.]|nr:Rieske (2Fe-2S) protein [Alloacidobacterium sp.]